jgi:hypothetical protein
MMELYGSMGIMYGKVEDMYMWMATGEEAVREEHTLQVIRSHIRMDEAIDGRGTLVILLIADQILAVT